MTTAIGQSRYPEELRQAENVRQVASDVSVFRHHPLYSRADGDMVKKWKSLIASSRRFVRAKDQIVSSIEMNWTEWPQDVRDTWREFARGVVEWDEDDSAEPRAGARPSRRYSLWVMLWFRINGHRVERAVAEIEDALFWIADAVLTQLEIESADHEALVVERLVNARSSSRIDPQARPSAFADAVLGG